jgi:hypothetical protein
MPPSKKKGTSKARPKKAAPSPRLVRGDDTPEPPLMLRPCVVLAPASKPLDDALHRALRTAQFAPRVEHDPRMAMAEVCLLRREARQRRAASADPEQPAPLVLVASPAAEERLLLAALHTHVPDVPVYQFDGAALQQLHTPDASDAVEPPVIVQPPHQPEVTDDELSTLLTPRQEDGSSRNGSDP